MKSANKMGSAVRKALGRYAAMLFLSMALPVVAGSVSYAEGQVFAGAPHSLTVPDVLPPSLPGRSDSGRPLKRATLRAASARAVDPSVTGRQIMEKLARGEGVSLLHAAAVPPVITDGQRAALRALSVRGGVRIHFDRQNGTPTFVRFPRPAEASVQAASQMADSEAIARLFLRAQRDLFRLKEPDQEMRLVRSDRDRSGREHLHFQQLWQGIPLWGKQLIVHLDGRKRVYLVNGRYAPSPEGVDMEPRLTAEEALAVVRGELGSGSLKPLDNILILYGEGRAMRLAYKVDVRVGLEQRWRYFIDARSGDRLHRVRNTHMGKVVSAQGADALGFPRRFTAWEDSGIYYLIDPTRPENDVDGATDPVNRPEPTGDTFIFDARNGSDQLWYVTSARIDQGWDPVAVSAAYNTRRVYEYYRDTFGRKSIDDKQMNLMVVIHFEQDYPNAFWNGMAMVYGDGDGELFSSLARCLDVAAHEMTHGVIEHTANLRYENQSGALNESFADLFGAMVDRDDWLIGEDCTRALPGHLRDMRNPANGLDPQTSRMSEYRNLPNTEAGDWGGVHVNSGIPNRAAYLTAESVGREKTEQIYYRALRFYLTASSRFIDARRALIQAAEDLHGADSAEVAAVKAAWDAVEVSEGDVGGTPSPTPAPLEPVEGDDLMIYLYPLDGTGDVQSERFVLYRQNLTNPADELLSNIQAFYTRPAVYTGDMGTRYLFVGSDNNLHELDETGRLRTITTTADIYSIAVSPDGRYLAYTSTDPLDDQIHLLDLESQKLRDLTIVLPDYQQEGSASAGRVRYADSLAFDYSGEVLLFDALICLSRPDNECDPADPSTGFNYWTIGLYELNSLGGGFYYPFPAQNPLFDLGYPSFAHNTREVIVFDLQEYDERLTNVKSSVVTLDLERQEMYPVVEFEGAGEVVWGVPSFWGSDDYVTLQWPSGSGTVAMRVPLGKGEAQWQGEPSRAEQINDHAVAMPLMHRAGQRALSRKLKATTTQLDFGELPAGTSRTLTVELINVGNIPVEITSIGLQGSPFFSQNGVNTMLSPQGRLPVEVTFSPPEGRGGIFTGVLTVTSNATPSITTVSVRGTTMQSGGQLPADDGGSSGSGGAVSWWLLILLSMVPGLRLVTSRETRR